MMQHIKKTAEQLNKRLEDFEKHDIINREFVIYNFIRRTDRIIELETKFGIPKTNIL